ncbi:DUF6541 family protein [Agromyces bauzanensis]
MTGWEAALPAALAALALLVVPGAAVSVAFGLRGITLVGVVPLASVSVIGLTTLANHVLPFQWGVIPVVVATIVLTALVVAVRWLLRARWQTSLVPVGRAEPWIAGAAILVAFTLIAIRFAAIFGAPDHISQTFDNVFHLNAVRYIMDVGDASPLHLGSLTYDLDGVPSFYPGTWHALVATVAELSAASVPVAVNATNIVIGGLVWPAGAVLLSRVAFGPRVFPALATGVLAAAFGAFPYLMIQFGVLYPNLLSIALLPGALAAAALAAGLGTESELGAVPRWMLLVVVIPGLALAHPSTLVAFIGFAVPIALVGLFQYVRKLRATHAPASRYWLTAGLATLGFAAGAILFRVARPPSYAAFWGPWSDPLTGAWAAFTSSPMNTAVEWSIVVLTVLGVVGILVTRRHLWLIGTFAIGIILYVIAVSAPSGLFRYLMVGTWYNDTNRLAALLPVVALPVAVAGAAWVLDLVGAALARLAPTAPARRRTVAVAAVAAVLLIVIGVITQTGPQLDQRTRWAQRLYVLAPDSPLLSSDEAALLERLGDEVPEGVVVAGSPWTGASLVYAISDRRPLLPAIFGDRRGATVVLMESLRAAGDDPEVCDALREANVGFVLDFGAREVHPGEHPIPGFAELEASDAVRLVDQEGEARLYEVTACR